MTNQVSQENIFSKLFFPFATYVFLFVGTGFISGAVVHSGDVEALYRYMAIGVVGVFLFVLGSYVQEVIYDKKNLKEEGVLPFLFFSLLLSLGIGMISGGTQHFIDFPQYASFLIPAGIVIALIAFTLKNNIHLTQSKWVSMLVTAVLGAGILWGGLNSFASTLPESTGHGHGAARNQIDNCAKDGCPGMERHGGNHKMSVENDADFVMGMIPHHQEAVDTSAFLLTRTSDPELQQFLKDVIDVQATEIGQMKVWHTAWFNSEYKTDGKYMPMMGDLTKLQGKELEKAYIQGMIAHHKGAIDMANQIVGITSRPEIKTMAQAINVTQTKEVTLLEGWLQSKYSGIVAPILDTNMMDEDGHSGMMHH